MIIVHSQCWFYPDVPCTPLGPNIHYHCLKIRRVVDVSPSPAVPSTPVLDIGQRLAPLCSKASRRSTCPRKDWRARLQAVQVQRISRDQSTYAAFLQETSRPPSTKAWAQLNRLLQSTGVVFFEQTKTDHTHLPYLVVSSGSCPP